MEKFKNAFGLRFLWLAMSVVLALLVTSCSDDEKDEPEPEPEPDTEAQFSSRLVGTWSYTDVDGVTYVLDFSDRSYASASIHENVYINGEEISTATGIYFFDGKKLTINGVYIEFVKSWGAEFTVEIKGSTAFFYGDGETHEFKKVRNGEVTPDPDPKPEPEIDSRIIGTWDYTEDGDTYRLQFSENGEVVESVSTDNYRDKVRGKFTFDGTKLVLPEDMAFTNNWGTQYTVVFSGNSMILSNNDTMTWGVTVKFTKKGTGTSTPDPEPEPEPEIDSRIIGTWEYTEDDIVYRLEFKTTGSVTETVFADGESWSETGKFTFDGKNLTLPEDFSFSSDWGTDYTVTFGWSNMTLKNSLSQQSGVTLEFRKR